MIGTDPAANLTKEQAERVHGILTSSDGRNLKI